MSNYSGRTIPFMESATMAESLMGVDVDGVLADLHPAWLEMYNRDFDDNKTAADMREWDITKTIKAACSAEKMISYLSHPDLYKKVKPVEGALVGVNRLKRAGFRVVYVTACEKGSEGNKYDWMVQHGFLETGNDRGREDWIQVRDKSLAAVPFLIDDHLSNIQRFPRTGILFDAPYNNGSHLKEFTGICMRGWKDVDRIIRLSDPSILETAQNIVHGARQKDYGSPLTNHTRTADFYRTYLGPKLKDGAQITAEDVSILNILQKVSRAMKIITKDTIVDIAGYAANIEMIKQDRGEW
jgi:5'(3')-deoxyribonucleotidase